MTSIKNAADVARWNLCHGCGACAYACPHEKIDLIDFTAHGLRPVLKDTDCGSCTDCLTVCSGVGIAHSTTQPSNGTIASLSHSWGPVLEVWEGFATDTATRHQGSSGGLATALATFCLEHQQMRGVVHIGPDDHAHHLNASRFSQSSEKLLAVTGSRYAPASPCDHLQAMEDADGPCVFIGKPCDVQGLRKAQALRPQLDAKVGVAIGIFCAGTPSTQGTLDLLAQHGIDPKNVDELRYRGRGWPGQFSVRLRGDADWRDLATYEAAWGFLQKYRPYRCHLCPDGTSEFADISCGDPWYRDIQDGEEGRSLVLVRTEAGRAIVRAAMAAGAISLVPVAPEVLHLSQRELQRKRGAIWGRLLTMRAAGIPTPQYTGFSLFRNWLQIPFMHKARSLVGTARRIVSRKYFRPQNLSQPSTTAALPSATATRPLRACMLAYTFYENDGRVIRYAEALANDGAQVDAIVLRRPGLPTEENINGVRVLRIQEREKNERGKYTYFLRVMRFFFRSMIEITRRHAEAPYDVIHVHSVPDFEVFAAFLPKLLGAKLVLDIHDIVPEFYAAKFGVSERSAVFGALKLVERLSTAFADHVIIANDLWLRKITTRSSSPVKCSAFINYPDQSIFYPALRDRRADGKFIVTYPGTLNWHQGLDIAIRAFAIVKDRAPDMELHIYGEGPAKEGLMQLVKDLDLNQRVFIESPLPLRQIATVMANADLGVVPKRNDSFGGDAFSTKTMEFMSLGVPLVIADTRIDKFYFNDSLVRFFRAGDEQDLANTLLDAYTDRATSARLSANALDFARQNNWAQKKSDYLAIVRRLAHE